MASDLNQFTFSGRLGRDPESRAMPSGDEVVSFSVACGETWKDKETGDKRERTEWIRCVCFKGLAKIAQQYLRKGQQIIATGKYRTNKWQDKEGKDRETVEVVLNEMHMVGGRPEGASDNKPAAGKSTPQPQRQSSDYDKRDDSIPF